MASGNALSAAEECPSPEISYLVAERALCKRESQSLGLVGPMAKVTVFRGLSSPEGGRSNANLIDFFSGY